MSAPPPPHMKDELVEEILHWIPPDSPASLIRAGLVCKRWCRLVSDLGFRHRYSEFHRRRRALPPMIGFLTYSHCDAATRFVPTSASLPHTILRGLKPCDSRHGRVLLHATGCEHNPIRLVVWNPTTGEQLQLPEPPPRLPYMWSAAVLCATAVSSTAGGGACDHLDCPFIVVIVGTGYFRHKTRVYIYNSEAGAWSDEPAAFVRHSGGSIDRSVRSALVGNTLYFLLRKYMTDHPYKFILEYNLVTRGISVVKLPKARRGKIFDQLGSIEFTTMEDGRLGFVKVEDDSRLCLWSRKAGEPGWVLCKAIRLADLLPFHDDPWDWTQWRILFGSAEGVGIILLVIKGDLFTVDLRTGRMTKVYKHGDAYLTVPYMNFCTPVFRAPASLEGPRTSTSSDT